MRQTAHKVEVAAIPITNVSSVGEDTKKFFNGDYDHSDQSWEGKYETGSVFFSHTAGEI